MVSRTLAAISDDKSLILFNTVVLSSGNIDLLISKLGITIKQYYSRMSALTNAGLIQRNNRKYSLTSFGKVIYAAQVLIGRAKQNFWNLKAIDSVVDNELKEIILGCNRNKAAEIYNNRPSIAPQQPNAF